MTDKPEIIDLDTERKARLKRANDRLWNLAHARIMAGDIALLERLELMLGVPATSGTAETDADPANPNVRGDDV